MPIRLLVIVLLIAFAHIAAQAETPPLVHGIALQPDGTPAENATVAIATFQCPVTIKTGDTGYKPRPFSKWEPVKTDAKGQFKFPSIDFEAESEGFYQPVPGKEKVDFILIVTHDTGFKRITPQDWSALDEKKTITLEPWGRIEGTVKQGTQPGKNLPVECIISFNEDMLENFNAPQVFSDYNTITDESGKFVFDKVPPAFIRVGRTIQYNKNLNRTSSHVTSMFALKPGETTTVTVGGVGRPVIGKLVPAKEFETPPDWGLAYILCEPAPEEIPPPDAAKLAKMKELFETMVPQEIREGLNPARGQEWLETEEGKKFQAAEEELNKDVQAVKDRNQAKWFQYRVCAVAEDGTFRLDDIFGQNNNFDGNWQLTLNLESPPSFNEPPGIDRRIGTLEHTFSIQPIKGSVSDLPLDLGTLEVEKLLLTKPMPRVGDTAPGFEIKKIEPLAEDEKYEDKGEKLRLSDYKGKYVILDFWATWCGPCLAKVPELQKLYEKIKDNDRFVLLGISLDGAGSEEKLGRFIVNRKMPWLHGLAGDWNGDAVRSYGVGAIPTMVLVDLEGKVVLFDPELPVLVKKIEELLCCCGVCQNLGGFFMVND